jgi:hypothetical protein
LLHGLYHKRGEQIVKATGERNVFKRGKGGVYYVRRRIPKPLLTAYPQGKTEIVRSLVSGNSAASGLRGEGMQS